MSKTGRVINEEFSNITSKEKQERLSLGVEEGEGCTMNPNIRLPLIEPGENEKYITQPNCNGYISIGHDRPSHLFSGYGGSAGTECATIDICVGAGSSLRTKVKGKRKSLDKENVIGKIFASDASRIYISQQTDIDDNFGLPHTEHSDTQGHAGIAIKSDHVRVIGRSSLKFFAGKGQFDNLPNEGELNARGEAIKYAATIEFIAGDTQGLQPIVKGTNLQKCLGNVYDHLSRINQTLLLYDQAILTLRGALMAHFHMGAGVGAIVTFPDPILIGQMLAAVPGEISNVINNSIESMNVVIDKAKYLGISPDLIGGGGGSISKKIASLKTEDFILSSTVFTT